MSSSEVQRPAANPRKAIAFKVLSVCLITIMFAVVKSIEGMPLTELMFFRSFLAFLPLAIYLALRKDLGASFRTRRAGFHLFRTILGLVTMGLTFLAVRALPLPEAVTLQYTQPLFVVALSALFLAEPVRLFRWAAVGVGFAGALVITWPKLTLLSGGMDALSETEVVGAGAALLAAGLHACVLLIVRQLVQTDRSTTLVLWQGVYATILLGCTMPFGWVWPDAWQWVLLILVGLLGVFVQITLSEALRAAPASTSAPFEYSSLIFATALGFALFGDLPDGYTLTGGAILIGAGLAILWRERRLSRQTATAPSDGIARD